MAIGATSDDNVLNTHGILFMGGCLGCPIEKVFFSMDALN
jgi:hypothetical protein